jgi:hypothetical protein
LDVHRATNGVDNAAKFNQHAVTGGFDNATPVFRYAWINQCATVRLKRCERSHLVGAHQAAVANHIRRQNRCEPALHRFPHHHVANAINLPAFRRRHKAEDGMELDPLRVSRRASRAINRRSGSRWDGGGVRTALITKWT